MGGILKLAWRSIWRNRRRTLISMSAAALGLTLVVIYSGLLAGLMGDATNELDRSGMGHVEAYAEGWRARQHPSKAIPHPAEVLARLRLPEGAQAGYRVVVRALASSAHGSEGVELHGVEWGAESRLASYVHDVPQGAAPAAGDERGILVGEQLAKRLKLTVGSKLRVMSPRVDGEMGADLFRVRGIFHSVSPALSQRRVLVSASAAQALTGMGDAANQLVIQLPRPEEAQAVATSVGAALGPGFEALTYGQLVPVLQQMEGLLKNVTFFAALFVYFLVGLGILNTALMSVLERTREFGVMLAIGTRPRRIVSLVFAESFWIATLSVLIGGALGLAVTWWGSQHTLLDFSRAMGEGFDYGGMTIKSAFNTRFLPVEALKAAVFVYLMALCVGLFPAWRVSRLRPADALRRT